MLKLFGNRKKTTLPEEVRMHYSASSFSFAMGDVFPCSEAEEAKLLLKDRQGYIVVLVPGEDLLAEPRPWVKALSLVSYVVVFGDEKEKYLKRFLTLLDGQIFSPIPKTLAGSICVSNPTDVKKVVQSLPNSNRCITIIPR